MIMKAKINCYILALCFLFPLAGQAQDLSFQTKAAADEVRLFYSQLVNLMYARQKSDREYYVLKEGIRTKADRGERFMNDYDFSLSPSPVRTSIDSYISGFVQLMVTQFRNLDGVLVSFKQTDLRVTPFKDETYLVSFNNSLRVNRDGIWEDIVSGRKVTFVLELARKSSGNRIREIAYEVPVVPKPEPVVQVTEKPVQKPEATRKAQPVQPVRRNKAYTYDYTLSIKEGNETINSLSLYPSRYVGNFTLEATVRRKDGDVVVGYDEFVPAIRSNEYWLDASYHDITRNLRVTAGSNTGKRSRTGSLVFLNDSGKVVRQLFVSQYRASKYEFPSFFTLNGDEEYHHLSLVYQPKMEFGLQYAYQWGRWFAGVQAGIGYDYASKAFVQGSTSEMERNTHNVGDDYLYFSGPGYLNVYSTVYDPYGEASSKFSYMGLGGVGGFVINDMFAIEGGVSWLSQCRTYDLADGYNVAAIRQPDGSMIYEYESSGYPVQFGEKYTDGIGFNLGLNGFIHFSEWEKVLKIGAGYRYSPSFKEYNNFYVSIGWVWGSY